LYFNTNVFSGVPGLQADRDTEADGVEQACEPQRAEFDLRAAGWRGTTLASNSAELRQPRVNGPDFWGSDVRLTG
jgi:hypothetical protein